MKHITGLRGHCMVIPGHTQVWVKIQINECSAHRNPLWRQSSRVVDTVQEEHGVDTLGRGLAMVYQ